MSPSLIKSAQFLNLVRSTELNCAFVFSVKVEPVVGLEDLVGELGEAEASVRICLRHRQPRLDALA